MPSIVWCDRAPYKVQQSQTEVQTLVEVNVLKHREFVWLDSLNGEEQYTLRIKAISAVQATSPPQRNIEVGDLVRTHGHELLVTSTTVDATGTTASVLATAEHSRKAA